MRRIKAGWLQRCDARVCVLLLQVLAVALHNPCAYAPVLLPGRSGECRRLVANGGLYLNGVRVDNIAYIVREEDVLGGSFVVRSGRKRHVVVTVV